MAEENNTETNKVDYKAEVEGLAAQLQEAQKSIENMAAHQEKLLGETKAAKAAKKEADDIEANRAKDNGEFESLLKASEERNELLQSQINDNSKVQVKNNINNLAQKITNELKAIPQSAEALKQLVLGEIASKVDENGTMSESLYNSIMKDLSNKEAYAPLMLGNQSNGGGAAGTKSSAQTKTINNNLSPMARLEWARTEGKE